MFHIGHLNLLRRAKEHCDHLIAAVATDEFCLTFKSRGPVVPFEERAEILRHIDVVDEVIPQESDDRIATHRQHPFDVTFKGTDWQGTPKGDALAAQLASIGVDLVYLPYTETTSSTHLRRILDDLLS